MANDRYDLGRFLEAQASTYERARRELALANKQTHWMWFIFPQIAGLGSSATTQRYAIRGLNEASAYLEHSVLGARLRECVSLVNRAHPTPLAHIFGRPDDLKFHSSVTLFALASESPTIFADSLRLWFQGQQDDATLTCLSRISRF